MDNYIIFDYDGILHNSLQLYAPAFKQAYQYLIEQGYVSKRKWRDEEISQWLGYSSREMWNRFMPELPESQKQFCSQMIGNAMLDHLKEGKAELYEGATDMLQSLKDDYFKLILLSNCKIDYMNEHRRLFQLDNYFIDYYCTEQFNWKPKHEIFKVIKEKYTGTFVIIGDREVDMEIASIHQLLSIGCTYGYGNLDELCQANYLVENVHEITELLQSIDI